MISFYKKHRSLAYGLTGYYFALCHFTASLIHPNQDAANFPAYMIPHDFYFIFALCFVGASVHSFDRSIELGNNKYSPKTTATLSKAVDIVLLFLLVALPTIVIGAAFQPWPVTWQNIKALVF